MALLTIVPAKWRSTRVPLKNYREFHDGKCLVSILIEKLKRCDGVGPIYLSCENPDVRDFADRHGVEFHHRDDHMCDNDTPLTEWIRGTVREVSVLYSGVAGRDAFDCDVLWAQCCDPLLNEYQQLIDHWNDHGRDFDSCPVVYPQRKYLLDAGKNPIGFGFGPWHKKSQLLPVHYEFGFTASILTRESIDRVGYHIGAAPLWYESSAPTIDIDTLADFELARQVYAARLNAAQQSATR